MPSSRTEAAAGQPLQRNGVQLAAALCSCLPPALGCHVSDVSTPRFLYGPDAALQMAPQ